MHLSFSSTKAMNTIGNLLRLTTFGESHGKAIGGILDGLPPNTLIDTKQVQSFLSLRSPGKRLTSPREEPDIVEFLSGLDSNSLSTGAPIAFVIANVDQRPKDYNSLSNLYRPSHADYTYALKYGIHGETGGGRSSARETAVRCVAGAIALQWLKTKGVEICAYVSQVGKHKIPQPSKIYANDEVYQYETRCPHSETDRAIRKEILQLKEQGNSIGGIVTCQAYGVPIGWGAPLYNKLNAQIAFALMSINAAKGVEIGDGFSLAELYGTQANDPMQITPDGKIKFLSNHSGGIQGGISNGEVITARVAFKPTATITLPQQTITHELKSTIFSAEGRHDPCIAIRAVPVVQSMFALALADAALQA